MPSYAIVTLGAFVFDGAGGASVNGDIVIGPVPRTVNVSANALSAEPVQTTDFWSDFGVISFPAKLSGRETIDETAANHLQRMWANLRTEINKDSNTLVIQPLGMDNAYTYRVFKNDRLGAAITALTQSRSVMQFDVSLKYLP
jgi:hypothetical protein